MPNFLLLLAYTLLLLLAVLGSGLFAQKIALTHTRIQLIMSFVSGLMLGIAIFHLLPHAIYTINPGSHDLHDSIEPVVQWLMIGLLSMFLLLRLFHFHHHDAQEAQHDSTHCSHNHDESADVKPSASNAQSLVGIVLGLTIHTVIDGVALAASIQADSLLGLQGSMLGVAGVSVFIAILLHKPLDALTLMSLMRRAHCKLSTKIAVLSVFALICPAAAALILFGFHDLYLQNSFFIGAALAFSAGVFLCISLSDLLPEIHFHNHDRFKMTVVLLLGIVLALAINWVEPDHRHSSNWAEPSLELGHAKV